jgi:integrase/recombinase XerD
MRVEQVLTPGGATRYLLVDEQGEIVTPVLRYLKFLDTGFTARNTLRTYCYQLRSFFAFLQERNLRYPEVGIDEMAAFVRWLQYPMQRRPPHGAPHGDPPAPTHGDDTQHRAPQHRAPQHHGLLCLPPEQPARKPRTVNATLTSVLRFYTYLMIHEDYSLQLSARLKQQLAGARRPFKDFLYHLSRDRPFEVKRLRVRVPKERPKTIPRERVAALVGACHNLRDAFLVRLLWESAMRIGEALALWLEDVEIDSKRIHVRDRGQLVNEAEIKTEHSRRILDVSADLIDAYLEYIGAAHTLDVATNHVFLKLAGPERGAPMTYIDVAALFRRLRHATGIAVNPHTLRRSSLTTLRRAGWKDEQLMRRAGHAHVQTTMQDYLDPDDDDLREAWERAEARLRLARAARTS